MYPIDIERSQQLHNVYKTNTGKTHQIAAEHKP